MRNAVPLALVLAGCFGRSEEVVVESAGRMCLHDSPPDSFADPGDQSFVANAPITVVVELIDCLSSSCDVDRSMSCTIGGAGTARSVTSIATWTSTGDSACTADCGQLATSCTTDALPAGDYQFTFGGRTLTLPVPSDALAPPCLEVAQQ